LPTTAQDAARPQISSSSTYDAPLARQTANTPLKGKFAAKGLRDVQPSIHMAQKVGT
jgi:hypothetical protein